MKIKLGTRPSNLALYQANKVKKELENKGHDCQIVLIKTTGDKVLDRSLRQVDSGGKALFLKELEEALVEGRVDFAVHSLKDVPGILDEHFCLPAFLKRSSPWDLIISKEPIDFHQVPVRFNVATDSPRRQKMLNYYFSWVELSSIRGNVESRIRKLKESSHFDATILAEAGLKRLDLLGKLKEMKLFSKKIPLNIMVPAVGQGVIAVQCMKNNHELIEILTSLNDPETRFLTGTEREFLKLVAGDCHTPLAAYCRRNIDNPKFLVMDYFLEQNGQVFRGTVSGSESENLSRQAFNQIKQEISLH